MIQSRILKVLALVLSIAFLFQTPAFAGQQFFWQDSTSQSVNTTISEVPSGSFKGGYNGPGESVPDDSLYICRGDYQNSVHPGKLWKSWCHIAWGGREILLDEFEILVTRPGAMTLMWVSSSTGAPKPENMIQGGYNDASEGFGGYPLNICRVDYRGGVHPGKLWRDNCNISWGGKEIPLGDYEILLLDASL